MFVRIMASVRQRDFDKSDVHIWFPFDRSLGYDDVDLGGILLTY